LPRSFNTQDASIEFVILHGCDFLMSGAPSRKGRPQVGQWYLSGFSCFLPGGASSERPAAVKGAPVF